MDGDDEGRRASRSRRRLGRADLRLERGRGLLPLNDGRRALREIYPGRDGILAAIALSAVLLVAGLNLPVLTTRQVWFENTFSIFSGIEALYKDGHRALAALVFFFSILFPIVKLAALTVIWTARMGDAERRRMLYVLMALGKWSMLDVFVVAVVVVAVKAGLFANAFPEPGIYVFGGSILLAMVSTALVDHWARHAKRA